MNCESTGVESTAGPRVSLVSTKEGTSRSGPRLLSFDADGDQPRLKGKTTRSGSKRLWPALATPRHSDDAPSPVHPREAESVAKLRAMHSVFHDSHWYTTAFRAAISNAVNRTGLSPRRRRSSRILGAPHGRQQPQQQPLLHRTPRTPTVYAGRSPGRCRYDISLELLTWFD
jgi:hypothetical protein